MEIPPNQRYAVCRSFIEILDTVSIFASERSDDVVAEMRRALTSYLANYLD